MVLSHQKALILASIFCWILVVLGSFRRCSDLLVFGCSRMHLDVGTIRKQFEGLRTNQNSEDIFRRFRTFLDASGHVGTRLYPSGRLQRGWKPLEEIRTHSVVFGILPESTNVFRCFRMLLATWESEVKFCTSFLGSCTMAAPTDAVTAVS